MPQDPKSDGLSNAPPTLERRPYVTTLHYSKWPLVINAVIGRMHKQQAPLHLALCQERGMTHLESLFIIVGGSLEQ